MPSRFARARVAQLSGLDFSEPAARSLEYFQRATELKPTNLLEPFHDRLVALRAVALGILGGRNSRFLPASHSAPEYTISHAVRALAV